MSELQKYVDESVRREMTREQLVDVHRMAASIHAVFPEHSLEEITVLVSTSVIVRHGNAQWLKATA